MNCMSFRRGVLRIAFWSLEEALSTNVACTIHTLTNSDYLYGRYDREFV